MSVRILVGDCRKRLGELESDSVHCCITSPPYWGLRDYGTEPLVWGGDDPECRHEWGDELPAQTQSGGIGKGTLNCGPHHNAVSTERQSHGGQSSQFRHHCSAWRGSLGLEPTPALYVQHIVEIMRDVRRVLRDDGTVWLNLGDSYSQGGGKQVLQTKDASHGLEGLRGQTPGMQSKQLLGIPWRVAFALQSDGWWLRSSIIWAKGISFGTHKTKCPHCNKSHEATYSGSSMPESVRDRPSQSYEYVFLLSKSKRYFYDQEAVKEAAGDGSDRWGGPTMDLHTEKAFGGAAVVGQQANRPMRTFQYSGTRNLRSVWTINPRGFKEAHFATFPTSLVTPMMKAGTSERGCCEECEAQWVRVLQHTVHIGKREPAHVPGNSDTKVDSTGWKPTSGSTLGWRPTCTCYQASPWPFKNRKIKDDMLPTALPLLEEYSHLPTIPCTALDPCGGAGTVGVVGVQLNRNVILCELSQDYCDMSRRRIEKTKPIEVVINKGTKKQDVFVAEQSTMFPVEVL